MTITNITRDIPKQLKLIIMEITVVNVGLYKEIIFYTVNQIAPFSLIQKNVLKT